LVYRKELKSWILNPDLKTISKIGKIIDGNTNVELDMPPHIIALYKFVPLTSCDVERSFSIYKTILTDNRSSFTVENLEKYIVSSCDNRK
jgi:hypothetical protein